MTVGIYKMNEDEKRHLDGEWKVELICHHRGFPPTIYAETAAECERRALKKFGNFKHAKDCECGCKKEKQ